MTGYFHGYRMTVSNAVDTVTGAQGELLHVASRYSRTLGNYPRALGKGKERYMVSNSTFISADGVEQWMTSSSATFRHMMIGDRQDCTVDHDFGYLPAECDLSCCHREFPIIFFSDLNSKGSNSRLVKLTAPDIFLIAEEASNTSDISTAWMNYWLDTFNRSEPRSSLNVIQVECVLDPHVRMSAAYHRRGSVDI